MEGGVTTKQFIKGFEKVNDIIMKIQTVVGCIVLSAFIIMVGYQVIARFTPFPAYFTEEFARICFLWTAFMGSPIMLRKYEHYRFTGIAEKLKGKAFWINEFICLCILLTISIIMLVHGIRLCNLFKSWHLSSMFNVSRIWLWLCLPISGATSTLYVLEAFAKFIDDPSTRAIKNEADKLLEQTESEDNRP